MTFYLPLESKLLGKVNQLNYSGSALLKFNGLASSGQNRIILLRTFCIIIVTIRDMLSYQLYTCRSPSEKRTRSVHL